MAGQTMLAALYRREDVVAVVRAFSPGIHRVLEVSLAANARIDAELERPRRPRHVDRHAITLDEVALHPVKRGVPGGSGVGAQEPPPTRARRVAVMTTLRQQTKDLLPDKVVE